MSVAPGTAYFASDVHWQPANVGDPAPLGLFGRFLDELSRRAKSEGGIDLYILGDLFDYWFERDGRGFAFYEPHVAALARARDAGVRLTLLFGNRDFTYGDLLTRQAGAVIAGDRVTLDLAGRRVLLEHGDLLCTGDWRYQLFRRLIRSRLARALGNLLSLAQMTRLIAWMRRASRAEIQRKKPSALAVVDRAVGRRFAAGFDIVVCGHVHRAARRTIQDGSHMGELITLGSWESDAGWYLRWDGALTLERYSGQSSTN